MLIEAVLDSLLGFILKVLFCTWNEQRHPLMLEGPCLFLVLLVFCFLGSEGYCQLLFGMLSDDMVAEPPHNCSRGIGRERGLFKGFCGHAFVFKTPLLSLVWNS